LFSVFAKPSYLGSIVGLAVLGAVLVAIPRRAASLEAG